jgi:alpha-L-rhamnosidase
MSFSRVLRFFVSALSVALVLDVNCAVRAEGLHPVKVLCENQASPLGTDGAPRLGWVLQSDHRAENQTAYEVEVASSASALTSSHPDMWRSGKISSAQSTLIPYAGKPLKSHSWYFWRVRIWDGKDHCSGWSKVGSWATGVLQPDEWRGAWISSSNSDNKNDGASIWFRCTFELNKKQATSALCSIASIGYHELYVNGQKVGDDVMAPAISDLGKRALYVTRDIAPYLHRGTNSIGVWLGQGWVGHTGQMWYSGSKLNWANRPRFLLQAQIQDGTRALQLATRPDWKFHQANTDSSYPPHLHNLGGELQDDRAYISGWSDAKFDDSNWPAAMSGTNSLAISPQVTGCNRIIDELHPIAIREKRPGVYQADIGRHFSGWIELKAEGSPGSRIELSMSEHEDQPSSYGQSNLFILGPTGRGTFSNHFKHQSGRWITVQGLSAPLRAAQLKGYAISTGTERIGQFTCSNDLYNRIYETVLWTFRQISLGGYVVDCPHRERMGYGDGINTVEGAMLAFDTDRFFTKWSRDWSDVQQPDGSMPFTAPTYNGGGGPMWSSTLVHLPWLTYLYFGDPRAMEQNYPAMRRWMDFLATNCKSNVLQWFPGPKNIVQPEWSFLGDWVYPGHQQAPNGHDRESLFMNNCYYLYTLKTAARIAQALGHADDAAQFQNQAAAAATAIHATFWDPQAKSYPGDRQTTPASALFSGLPPADARPLVESQLEERILKKHHLDTGILGTYFMIEALTAEDRCDLVDCVANTTESPGWGSMLAQGATCIWEQWDGGNSRCHSSYLSIGAWFIKGILGLRPDPENPGFRHFIVKPGLYEKLDYASGECNTFYGKITCAWKKDASHFNLNLEIPANTSATIFLPAIDSVTITESGEPLAKVAGIKLLRRQGNLTVLEAGSGNYRFESLMPNSH